VRETPEIYSQVTLPHVQSIPQSHIQWVHNILARKVGRWYRPCGSLSHLNSIVAAAHTGTANRRTLCCKAEVERLLFEDPDPDIGFMLHPDLKWDQVPG
jgi:m7GpppX diphosphatase